MNPFVVRPATAADADAIAELSGQFGYPCSREQLKKRLEPLLGTDDHAVMVAVAAEQVVGWIHVFLARRVESDAFAELGGLVVDRLWRGRGVGTLLLSTAESWTDERSTTKIRVRCRTDRADAQVFYAQRGFKQTKEQRVFDKSPPTDSTPDS